MPSKRTRGTNLSKTRILSKKTRQSRRARGSVRTLRRRGKAVRGKKRGGGLTSMQMFENETALDIKNTQGDKFNHNLVLNFSKASNYEYAKGSRMKVPVPQYYYALLNVLLRLKDYGYSGNVIFQRGKIKTPSQDLIYFAKKFTDLFGDVSVVDNEIVHTNQEQKHKWELANNLISGSAKELFKKTRFNYGIILESGSGGTKCAVCFRDSANLIWQCVHKKKIAIASENTGELQEFVSNVRTKSRDAPLAIVFSGGFVSTYQDNDGLLNKWMTANRGLNPNLQIPSINEISGLSQQHRLKEICQQREAEHEYKGFLAVFPEYETESHANKVFVAMGGGTVQCCVNGEYKPEVTKGIEGFNLKKGEQGNYVDNKIFSREDQNNICILSSTCFHIVDKEVAQYNLRLGLSTDQKYDIDSVVNTIKEKLRACFGLQQK